MKRLLTLAAIGTTLIAAAAFARPDEHEQRMQQIDELEARTAALARYLSDAEYALTYRERMRRTWYRGGR